MRLSPSSGNERLRRVVQPASKWDVLIRVLDNEPDWVRRRLSVAATEDTESVVSGVIMHNQHQQQQQGGGFALYR